jgi:hypothetical protein
MTRYFDDRRDPARVSHNLPDLFAHRITVIALGYEDLKDHNDLRNDPCLKLTATAKTKHGPMPDRLAEPSSKIRTHAAMAQSIHQNIFCPWTTWKT